MINQEESKEARPKIGGLDDERVLKVNPVYVKKSDPTRSKESLKKKIVDIWMRM